MENSFQTSFIPKKPITSSGPEKEPRSFFSIIAAVILALAILISIGLFAYKLYLTKQKQSLADSLTLARNTFEKDTISELELYDKRTNAAKKILTNHMVLSPLFSLLGDITIPSVQYTGFQQDNDQNGFLVTIKGVARDYRSIALQADIFSSVKGRSFKNVLFSNLTKDKDNNVTFDLKFNVDPDLLSYEKNTLLELTSPSLSNNQGVTTQ